MNKIFVQVLEALGYDIELTYVASVGEQEGSIEMRYEDENIC